MPYIVRFNLVWNWWPRTHQRHLAAENIPELRQFIEAGAAHDSAQPRHAGIIGNLEDSARFAGSIALGSCCFPSDEFLYVLFVYLRVVGNFHRPEFQELKPDSILANAL